MVPSPGGISPVTLGRPSAGPNRLAHCPTRRSRPGCWPCRQGREKIPETLPRKRAGRTGRRSQGSRTLIRQWTLYRYVGAQGQLRDPDHRHGARPGGARSRPARAGARADKYRTRVTFIGRDSSGPPRHNLRTRTWVAARNHRRITAPRTRTFNHGAALVVTCGPRSAPLRAAWLTRKSGGWRRRKPHATCPTTSPSQAVTMSTIARVALPVAQALRLRVGCSLRWPLRSRRYGFPTLNEPGFEVRTVPLVRSLR